MLPCWPGIGIPGLGELVGAAGGGAAVEAVLRIAMVSAGQLLCMGGKEAPARQEFDCC
jgi:hypothetical protein